jgi:hypothetical protein
MDLLFIKMNISKIVYKRKALQHPKRQHGFPMAWKFIDQVSVIFREQACSFSCFCKIVLN